MYFRQTKQVSNSAAVCTSKIQWDRVELRPRIHRRLGVHVTVPEGLAEVWIAGGVGALNER